MSNAATVSSRNNPARPNFVVIIADDQGPWALGSAGNPEIQTPSLDRLAAEGTRLEHFFCTSPVCSPARASLLTGRMPSAHGIHDALWAGELWDPVEYLAGQTAYTDVLAAAGYSCGIVGKWHMGAVQTPQFSFNHWDVWESRGRSVYWDPWMNRHGESVQVPGYATDIFTDAAIDFLRTASKDDRPFLLNVCYSAPHAPWLNEHPEEWVSLYDDCDFESCPQEPIHPWTRPRDQDWEPYVVARDDPKPTLQGWFGSVSAMDAGIGRIVDCLDGLGLGENTLVFFLSDNGFSCGHNGIWGKGNGTLPQNVYENSVRVPAILRQPGRVAAGEVRQELVSAYDVRPTLLSWAGLDDPDSAGLPGTDFGGLLDDRADAAGGHEAVVVFDEYGPVRMIRTDEWKYVHRYPLGPHELYHLAADPQERDNLVDDPARQGVVTDLRATLADWFLRHTDPRFDGTKEPVTGRGQIGPVGPAAGGRAAFNPEEM